MRLPLALLLLLAACDGDARSSASLTPGDGGGAADSLPAPDAGVGRGPADAPGPAAAADAPPGVDAGAAAPAPDAPPAPSCQSMPTWFAPQFAEEQAKDGFLYGWRGDSLVRFGPAGGTPEVVVGDINTMLDFGLVVDDAFVYWMYDLDTIRFYRAPRAGGGAIEPLGAGVVLSPGEDVSPSAGMLVDEDRLYVMGDSVMAIPKTGGAAVKVADFAGGRLMQEAVVLGAVDDRTIYWAVWDQATDTAQIQKAAKAGGPATVLASLPAEPGVFVDTWVVAMVADGGALYVFAFGDVYRVDESDGATTRLYSLAGSAAPVGGDHVTGIAVASGWVTWWSQPRFPDAKVDRAVLQAVRTDGSARQILLDEPTPEQPDGLLAEDGYLFFQLGPAAARATYRVCAPL